MVVTGAGIVTALGTGWQANLQGLLEQRHGFRPVEFFDVSRQRAQTAGVVTLPPMAEFQASIQGRLKLHRHDRSSIIIHQAIQEALSMAGNITLDGVPICVGTSAIAMPIGEAFYRQCLDQPRSMRHQLSRVHGYQAHNQIGAVVRLFGATAEMRIISNACASGASAIGHAFHLIRSGKASRVLAGGFDALSQLVFAGFDSLQALSPSGIPRPFDAHRDGLAIGEGAGFIVLESLQSAQNRDVEILAEMNAYAAATDVHHLTQPHPAGCAALQTMHAACNMAGVEPHEVDYINSHGTGTPLNDVAEANAIASWAGDKIAQIKVSSTKSATGHALGGAGSIEAVISLLAMKEGLIPANLHVRTADDSVKFDLVRAVRRQTLNRVLSNSFGFGGANATILFSKHTAA